MKSLKRIASLLVIAAFVFQIAVVAAPMPQDVVGTEFETAVGLLSALDIMVGDGENFNPDDNITRAEFAQILMKTMRLDDAVESYRPVGTFSDVPASDIFAPAVELGAQVGAISGYGDGTFGPNDPVTGEQAVKLMIHAVGYNVMAEMMGYPAGYLATASEIGILKNVAGSGFDMTAPISRGKAAILCYNTLKVDILKKVSFGNSEVTYTSTAGETLLSVKHNVYQFDGKVEMNGSSALDGTSSIRKDGVRILGSTNSELFLIGETDIDTALGKYIRAFYKLDEDSQDKTIISYEVMDSKNEIITVPMQNLVAGSYSEIVGSGDSAYRKVEYWADKDNDTRTKELRVSFTDSSIIYNGTYATAFEFDTAIAKDGEITFVDNDNDGIFEVLYVTAYENYVVSSIDTKEYIVNDKFETYVYNEGMEDASGSFRQLDLDLDSEDVQTTIVDKDGKEVKFSSLKEWTVLSVAQSDVTQPRQTVKIIVSTAKVTGVVNELDMNAQPPTVKVDDTVYQMAPNYVNYITKDGYNKASSLKVGDTYIFYLDASGKIAASEMSGASGDTTYGLLTRKVNVTNGADEQVMAKIYSAADKTLKTYAIASRATIDGVLCKTPALAMETLNTSLATANLYTKGGGNLEEGEACPLLFKLNEDGEITYIDTPAYNEGIESPYSLHAKATNFAKLTYRGGYLGSTYPVKDSAVFLEVSPTYSDLTTESGMGAKKKDELVSAVNDDNQYNSLLYCMEKDGIEVDYGVFMAVSAGDSIGNDHDLQFFVVNNVTTCISEYSEEKTLKVYGMMEGVAKEFVIKPEYYTSGKLYADVVEKMIANKGVTVSAMRNNTVLLPGDVIRYKLDNHSEASVAEGIYLSDVRVLKNNSEGGSAGKIWYRAIEGAAVYKVDGNYVMLQNYAAGVITGDYANGFLQPTWKTDTQVVRNLSQFKIMVYDASKPVGEQVYSGSVADVYDRNSSTPSVVIYQLRANTPRGMLVLKY